jgi:lysophospholipase L1-like esterase
MLYKANGKIALGFAVGFVLALTISSLPRWFNPWRHAMTDRRIKRAILFGDSITQEGSDPSAQGWVAALTAYWIRRIDVVNRGFGGYTSRWGLKIFDKVVMEYPPDILFVFFGANDATVPEHSQHVPLEEYKENLRIMVRKALSASITTFLLTPPPVYEPVLERRNKENGKRILNDRLNDNTQRYAEACKEVGRELSVAVIDNWTSCGGASPERAQFLRDGLHLNAQGNQQVFQNILGLIFDRFQNLKFDNLKLYQPHWSEIVENPAII